MAERKVYRYVFDSGVPFAEVLATLDLSLIAVQCLHGEASARLDARFARRAEAGTIAIDASTPVGHALNQVFVGYAQREFGAQAFRVERADRLPSGAPA